MGIQEGSRYGATRMQSKKEEKRMQSGRACTSSSGVSTQCSRTIRGTPQTTSRARTGVLSSSSAAAAAALSSASAACHQEACGGGGSAKRWVACQVVVTRGGYTGW